MPFNPEKAAERQEALKSQVANIWDSLRNMSGKDLALGAPSRVVFKPDATSNEFAREKEVLVKPGARIHVVSPGETTPAELNIDNILNAIHKPSKQNRWSRILSTFGPKGHLP